MRKSFLLLIIFVGLIGGTNAKTFPAAPPVGFSVTFNVDMSTAEGFNPVSDVIYLTGNFPGATWIEPGGAGSMAMARVGTTLIYTYTLSLDATIYEYKYFKNAGWGGGEYAGGSNRLITVSDITTQNDNWGGWINWANLQWPGTGSIDLGGSYDVYAQAYMQDKTYTAGPTFGLQAWIGYSTSYTDPVSWSNWVPAPFSGQSWDNDEFKADLGAAITTAGTYYYASRFQFGNGDYVYGGFNGGFWNGTSNISGVLTVNPATTPPTAFAVTGTGAYCQGGTGLAVGLEDSESGVTYTLYKNAVAQAPTVAGTGSAITFGDQLAGTYTVSGTSGGGTTPMTGEAVITTTTKVAVSVTISANINPVPEGGAVTLTAVPVNGGSAPSYHWMVNGTSAGTDNAVLTYNPLNGDAVTCTLTSSETCTAGNPATSNQIFINVIPLTNSLQYIVVANGEINCYSAIETIYVAGESAYFTVNNGGSATMIAGQNIVYFPGTDVNAGGYMHGSITINNTYCTNSPNPLVNSPVQNGSFLASVPEIGMNGSLRIYPNPAVNLITLEITGSETNGLASVEISNMSGMKMLKQNCHGERKLSIAIQDLRPGMYFVQVTTGVNKETLKLIKL